MSHTRQIETNLWFSGFGLDQFLLRMFYLLLSFPLGIAYFVFLVTGMSLGFGLAIIWIGLAILALVIAISWELVGFERRLAAVMLGADLPRRVTTTVPDGFLSRMKTYITDPVMWKGLLFLLLKFPLGIISFVLTITLGSVSLALLAAPLLYSLADYDFYFWYVATYQDALLCSLAGIAIGIGAVYLLNGLALLWREFAVLMLDGDAAAPRLFS